MKTAGGRLYAVMKHLGLNQTTLGDLLELSQSSVAAKISDKTALTASDALTLSKKGISIDWLLQGTGTMLPHEANAVSEGPQALYASKKYSMAAIRERFEEVIDDVIKSKKMTQGELAEAWGLNAQHLSNAINGSKKITSGMIIASLEHGQVNLNYLVGGIGAMYVNAAAEDSLTVKGLLETIRSQQATIEKLSGAAQQKKRA